MSPDDIVKQLKAAGEKAQAEWDEKWHGKAPAKSWYTANHGRSHWAFEDETCKLFALASPSNLAAVIKRYEEMKAEIAVQTRLADTLNEENKEIRELNRQLRLEDVPAADSRGFARGIAKAILLCEDNLEPGIDIAPKLRSLSPDGDKGDGNG